MVGRKAGRTELRRAMWKHNSPIDTLVHRKHCSPSSVCIKFTRKTLILWLTYNESVQLCVALILKQTQCTHKRDIEARSHNYFGRGKAISITYSECVSVALVIQHAKRMRLIILSSVPVRLYYIFHIFSQTARFSEKSYWT
jgi:hypothetical protein